MSLPSLTRKHRRLSILPTLLPAILLAGCAHSPLSRNAARFGSTAAVVLRQSSDAYSTVERITYQQQVSTLVLDFDRKGFDRKKIHSFLPPADLDARKTVLAGLQTYADSLVAVTSDSALTPVDTASQALSDQLKTLSSSPALQTIAPGDHTTLVLSASTAVDLLGKALIERRRRRDLPRILHEMQPVLDALCPLLQHDIGAPPSTPGGGHGLRDQLWNQYDNLIDNQTDFIGANKSLPPAERAAQIARLPALVREQAAADAALAATQSALHDLAETHRDLLRPQQPETFLNRVRQLTADGEQIATFYNTLATN